MAAGAAAAHSAYAEHVVGPLCTVRDELFHTFRDRPAIVEPTEFEQDQAALSRMLTDFHDDYVRKHPVRMRILSTFLPPASTRG